MSVRMPGNKKDAGMEAEAHAHRSCACGLGRRGEVLNGLGTDLRCTVGSAQFRRPRCGFTRDDFVRFGLCSSVLAR